MSDAFSPGRAIIWAISLGVLTAFTVGSTITVETARAEMVVTGLAFAVSVPILYVIMSRTWEQWAREQPLVRIVIYFTPLFVGTVTLDTVVYLVVGWHGLITTALDTVIAGGMFVLTIRLSFYRGADRVRDYVVDRLDAEW